MMERKFAKFFHRLVHELIPDNEARDHLFESLRQYQSSQKLHQLLVDLRQLLDEPDKLELYEFIRPLILLRHQMEYSYMAPAVPGVRLRTVRLRRAPGQSLGFAVRGGYEFSVGVFVSAVEPGSQAEKQGLKAGDEIVRVNGFTIAEAIHDDVLNLIKSRDEIVLKVTHIGMLPIKDHANDAVTWRYVEDMDSKAALDEVLAEKREKGGRSVELKIFIDCTGYDSIGCGILSGPRHYPGIFVEKVRPGSLAQEVGLEIGDQIVEVNESSFLNIGHKEAVVVLKGSKQLNVIVRKHAGQSLFEQRHTPTRVSTSSSSHSSQAPSTQSLPPPSQRWPPSEGSGFNSGLDEGQLIEQQLNRTSLSRWGSSQETEGQRSEQAYISTQAQVHSESDSSPPTTIGNMPRIPVEEHASATFLLPTAPPELPPSLLPDDLGSPNHGTPSSLPPPTSLDMPDSLSQPGGLPLSLSDDLGNPDHNATSSLPPLAGLDLPDSLGQPGDLSFSRHSPTSSSSSLAGNPAYSDSCSPPSSPVSSLLLTLPDDLGDPVLAVLRGSTYPPDSPPWVLPFTHHEVADPNTVYTDSCATFHQNNSLGNPDFSREGVQGFGNADLGKSRSLYFASTKRFFSVYSKYHNSSHQHANSDIGTNRSFPSPRSGVEGSAMMEKGLPVIGGSGGALMARYLREGRGDHSPQGGLHPLAEEDENEDSSIAEGRQEEESVDRRSCSGMGVGTDSVERRSNPPVFVPPPPPTSTPPPISSPLSTTAVSSLSSFPPPPPPLFGFSHSDGSAFRALPLFLLTAVSTQTQDENKSIVPGEERLFSAVTEAGEASVVEQPGEYVLSSTVSVTRESAVEDLPGESLPLAAATAMNETASEQLSEESLSATTVREDTTVEQLSRKSWSLSAGTVTKEMTVEVLPGNRSDVIEEVSAGSSSLDLVTVVGKTAVADAGAWGAVVSVDSGAAASESTDHDSVNVVGTFVEDSEVHPVCEAGSSATRTEVLDSLSASLIQASGSSSPKPVNLKSQWGEQHDGRMTDWDDGASGSVEGINIEVSVDVHQSSASADFTLIPTADMEKHEGSDLSGGYFDSLEVVTVPSPDFPLPPPTLFMEGDDDSKTISESEIPKPAFTSTQTTTSPSPETVLPSSFLPTSLLTPEVNIPSLSPPLPTLLATPVVLGGAEAALVVQREDQDEEQLPGLLGPAPSSPNAEVFSDMHVQLAVWFNPLELDGRELLSFVFSKSHTLGVELEGGMGTPLAGRIVIAAVFDGGAAMEQGLQTGDQLMMINGRKLTDVTVAEAEEILDNAYNGPKEQIQVVYVQSSFLNDEECVTYF